MNFKKTTLQLTVLLALFNFATKAQSPGCFLIPDLEGYKKAYKINQSGGLGYKEFFKTYKDSYLDTAYYISNSLKQVTKKNNNWRLTDNVGIAAPYCGGLERDEYMFLNPGAYNTLEADRFFGKKGILGLGALGGFAYYKVNQNDYEAKYNSFWSTITRVPASQINLQNSKNYQHFYLMVGPTLALPIGEKFGVDLSLKAGPTYNDVAYVGATNNLTGELLHRLQPGSDRWTLGGNAHLRLMYKIAERWRLGLNGTAFSANSITPTRYEVLDPVGVGNGFKIQSTFFDRRQSFFGGGLSIQHVFPTPVKHFYVPMEKLDPPTPAPVAVTPSLINPCDMVYSTTPFSNTFNWKSNDNQDDKANEMFTFKLYKVPSKEPILVKSLKESTLTLDAPLPVPSDPCASDEYYYTVHSTKGAAFSEMVTCSFKIRNAASATANCALAKKEEPAGPSKVFLTRILGNENFTRQIIKYDEGKGCKCPIDTLTRKGTKLVEYFRQYTGNESLGTWPDGLPIPKKASGFIYEVREVYSVDGAEKEAVVTRRYRMNVNRKTREVTLTPISSKKR